MALTPINNEDRLVQQTFASQASRRLLATLKTIIASMPRWTETNRTQAEVETTILDQLTNTLPQPPFDEQEISEVSARIYDYVWQRSAGRAFTTAEARA